MISNKESVFVPLYNKSFVVDGFPYFVPKEERDYNVDYAKRMVEDKWIYYRWREDNKTYQSGTIFPHSKVESIGVSWFVASINLQNNNLYIRHLRSCLIQYRGSDCRCSVHL